MEHVDVLVIGAGLSGISAAWHLQTRCPDRTYAIFEARDAIGGTWDLFRYPGVRSDSDMFTLGFRFRPWRGTALLADGPSIKAYIEETAREFGIDRKIRFRHRVVRAEWVSASARWTVDVEVGAERAALRLTCNFLYTCTGYYAYDRGYTPEWPGMARFRGRVVHPQQWPEDLEYSGKRVVVIGSGATAVTLVPAMATGPGAAAHVTMLQRSPSYIAPEPTHDAFVDMLRRVLPERAAYAAARWKYVLRSMLFYALARRWPALFTRLLRGEALRVLGPDYPVDTHLAPRYAPWDERLCIVPDSDLFHAIRDGRASIVTDHIATFDETGLALQSGAHLDADIIITATGLIVSLLHGITLVVDGETVDLARTMVYKGMMFTGVPNLASTFGYTNATWTLKADLTAEHVCRLLNHMRDHGYAQVTPQRDPSVPEEPAVDLKSGYFQRAMPSLPKQGPTVPWRVHQNYVKDLFMFRYGPVTDPALAFRRRTRPSAAVDPTRELVARA